MANGRWGGVLHYLRQLPGPPRADEAADAALLQRFADRRDPDAFAALLRRHGPLVLAVCRGLLAREQDAEDAFQATFLVLVRKAASIGKRASVGSWLYGVARRVAARARADARRRPAPEAGCGRGVPDPGTELARREAHQLLHEEVERLPARYRAAVVLCYLEGRSQGQAARQLGWTPGAVKGRLERARALLRRRLARRGLALAGLPCAAALAPAAVPAALAESVTRAAQLAATGAGAAAVPGPVAELTRGVLQAMFVTKVKAVTAVLLVLAALGAGVVWCTDLGRAAPPETPAAAAEGERRPAAEEEDGEQGFARLELDTVRRELIQVRSDLRRARLELALAEARVLTKGDPPIPEALLDQMLSRNPEAAELRRRLSRLDEQIRALERVSARGANEPQRDKLRAERDEVAKALQPRTEVLRVRLAEQLKAKARDESQAHLQGYRDRVAFLEALEKVLSGEVDRLGGGGGRGLSSEERIRRLEAEVRRLKAALDEVKKKKR
jgi:RNA polymerase sigma factor (sigma-70 family)